MKISLNLFILMALFFATACGTLERRSSEYQGPSEETLSNEETRVVVEDPVTTELGSIPNEMNESVQKWVNYFTGRGRPHMARYLARSSRYMNLMRKTLREEGVPEDLIYISLIESGFQSRAVSHASAVGYWQFIRGTGRRYGLIMNSAMDERKDPVRSTQAAAKYFKALYNLFGNWYLAMASYNAGENRIKRAVMNNYTRDFWELARRRKLPRETINYVPKFLAAKLIAENPSKYGFNNIDFHDAMAFDKVAIVHGIDLKRLAQKLGISYSELKKLNPAFRSRYIPHYRRGSSSIRVPVGMAERAQGLLVSVKSNKNSYYLTSDSTYRVRRGDSLYKIAKRYGTSVHKLKDLNNISGQSVLKIGTQLKIPSRGYKVSRKSRPLRYNVNNRYHRVRRGENLSSIAQKYGLSLSQLRRLNRNKIGRRSVIRVGQRLKVAESNLRSENGRIHIVRRGETLSHIARRYRTSISKLTQINSIRKSSKIMVGSRLVIPD